MSGTRTVPAGCARPPAWRVAIAGGGIPGQVLALALRRCLAGTLDVTLYDPQGERTRVDPRAYALSPASRNLLVALGLWDRLADKAQPIRGMTLTDSRIDDAIRPVYLRFEADAEPLGSMVEASDLQEALSTARLKAELAIRPLGVAGFEAAGRAISVALTDGSRDEAQLLVAADGARSRLRDLAGITWFGRRYPQSGIVASVTHERDHAGIAVQHFLPSGPFAMLPLTPRRDVDGFRSSLVWTERADRIPTLLASSREEAAAEVQRRFGSDLGRLTLTTGLAAHPLSVGLARRYVGQRFALLGDAAHEIHPLAGQGLNLALAGAAALAGRIADAVRLGLDPGADAVLAAYERDRRFDAVTLAGTTDGLNKLFANDRLPVRVIRDIGLGLVDRAPRLKSILAGEASGTASRAPRLMRGLAL